MKEYEFFYVCYCEIPFKILKILYIEFTLKHINYIIYIIFVTISYLLPYHICYHIIFVTISYLLLYHICYKEFTKFNKFKKFKKCRAGPTPLNLGTYIKLLFLHTLYQQSCIRFNNLLLYLSVSNFKVGQSWVHFKGIFHKNPLKLPVFFVTQFYLNIF